MKQELITISAFIKKCSSNYKQLKFSKKRIFTLLACFALFIVSCQKEGFGSNPQYLDISTVSKQKNLRKEAVPLKGGFNTMETVVSINGDIEHNRITGVGQLTHLGNSTFVADIEFSLTDFSAPITGVQTTVSANGDKIFSTFTGYASDPDTKGNIKAILSETITGGTGRFMKATGTFTVTANGNINVPEGKNTFDGTISY